ncbi:MAG: pilus assembly protein PilM [Nitrospirae bacterium]|nr:pilus assembly protein PilM [Nitrospirota bacterium]
MKIAGIDIDKDAVRVVELQKGMRTFSVAGFFSVPVQNGNLSGRDISFRWIRLPITDIKKMEKAISFEAEELLPFSPDELVIDYQAIEKTEKDTAIALVAVKKEKVSGHLNTLIENGIDPKAIDITPSAISAIAACYLDQKDTYTVIHIGSADADLAVFHGRDIRFFRNIPLSEGWEREACNTLYIYQAINREEIKNIYICGSTRLPDGQGERDAILKKELFALCSIEPARIDLSKGADIKIEGNGEYAKALGLALREADGKGFKINLRKGELAYKRKDAELKKRIRYTSLLAGIAVFLLILNFSVKYYTIESRYQGVAKEIRKAFKEAFPDAKNIVNEGQQMKAAVAETKKKLRLLGGRVKGDVTALDLFKEVTERMPAEHRVLLFEFNLEGDKIRLFGETTSFEAADKIKEALLKSSMFKEVAISDAKIGAEQNKVKFRINITLHEAI